MKGVVEGRFYTNQYKQKSPTRWVRPILFAGGGRSLSRIPTLRDICASMHAIEAASVSSPPFGSTSLQRCYLRFCVGQPRHLSDQLSFFAINRF
jgi:hypothetical protein